MRRALIALLILLSPSCAMASLRLSADQRFLIDEQGGPFFMVGDAAWSLIAQLDYWQAELYLQDRANRGFNLIKTNLLEHEFASNPPVNAYGVSPFTGAPFVTPNEAYFAYADAILELARQRDLVVMLAPVYLGFECGSQGWCQEIQDASLADMRDWGRFLGQRYASYDELIWLIGGDADPAPLADKLREVVAGIREFDTIHLITTHNQPEVQAITPWPNDNWIQINSVYTYSSTLYTLMKDAYEVTPVQPVFLLESAYENELDSTPQSLRAQSNWSVLSGGFGYIFGNCPIWHFGYSSTWCDRIDWQAELEGPGSSQMTSFRNLYESRSWYKLVPDFDHTVLTDGFGVWGDVEYATAAVASDGSSILAYLPSPRQVTVDTSALSGNTVRAWWYDAYAGTAEPAGTFAQGILTFAAHPPDDWVLVLDDAALDLPPPGHVPTTAPRRTPSLRVGQNHPNPFNPSTTLHYELAQNCRVTIAIHDATGRRVRLLLDAVMEAGAHEIHWDGRDERGRALSSGVYFCRVETPQDAVSRKLNLLK